MSNLVERITPSNWNVQSNDGTTIVAKNNVTGEVFNGPLVSYNAIFKNGYVEESTPRWVVDNNTKDLVGYRKSDGSVQNIVQSFSTPGGGIAFPGLSSLTAAVRNAVQYIVSHADLEARPPRLWPVDAVPYRLFCAVGGRAYGHGDNNRILVTVDTSSLAATVGYEWPVGYAITDIYAGDGCALVTVAETATNLYSLYRTTDGQAVELVHDIGRDPNGTLTHRPHVRILTRGLTAGYIAGRRALMLSTYNVAVVNGAATDGSIGDAVYLAASFDDGKTWQRINGWNWNFETGVGSHTIRHFHSVRYDQWRDCWWIAGGDTDAESCLIRWDGKTAGPGNVSPAQMQAGSVPGWDCRTGSQRWRAVDIMVTEDWIETFTDTVADLTGGIWRCRPDFSESHRVDHTVRGAQHDGWAALLASDGTHLWCDDCRPDTTLDSQRYMAIYASANGNKYWEIGRIALAGTGVKIPRGFFEANGLIWWSCDGEAGKGTNSTTLMRLAGRFIQQQPDNLAPVYFVDFANGSDAANGWGKATSWKTARNALAGNKITPGARVILSSGESVENGVGSMEYAANASPATDASRPVQISGQGRDATIVTLSGATEGWRGTSAQQWKVRLCNMTLRPADTTKITLWDNSTATSGAPEWYVEDARIGRRDVGTARCFYLRVSKLFVRRSNIDNTIDTTKYTFLIDGTATMELDSSVIYGGRSSVTAGAAVNIRHNEFRNYAVAAIGISSGATVAPLIANNVFFDSQQTPITNASAAVTLTAAMVYGNWYAKPQGAGVPDAILPIGGELARNPDTLAPYEWSSLIGLAQPAGVSWDYYGNPFRARPAIGAVEIPPTI